MEKIKLVAKARTEMGRKTNKGRKEGQVPAVVYGKGIESKSLWVNALDFRRLVKKSGESVVIDLVIDDKDERNVIIHDVQKDPVKNTYMHLDFYQVNMKEKIETEVEFVFIGESEAVKTMGGVLVKSLDKVTVKCLPADLPSHIDVDISKIKNFEEHICIKDLNVSPAVELEAESETVVALVAPPRTEEELSSLEEKSEADVTKVEGVVKEEAKPEETKEEKKSN